MSVATKRNMRESCGDGTVEYDLWCLLFFVFLYVLANFLPIYISPLLSLLRFHLLDFDMSTKFHLSFLIFPFTFLILSM